MRGRTILVAAVAALAGGCAWLQQGKVSSVPERDVPAQATAKTASATPAAAPAAPPAAPTPPAAAPAPPILPFDQAVASAAEALLGNAKLPTPAAGETKTYRLVIDPLIDGVTGAQSEATSAMGSRIVKLIRDKFPQYEVQEFTAATVAQRPLVLIGTFTGVNNERKTTGRREAYRICLALADLNSGTLVGKGLAFARMDGVDATPKAFYRDSPAWTEDPATLGYIRTCQGTKAGDPINPLYADRIVAAALISEAIDAYGAARYQEALDLYEAARRLPAGNQLRVYSGIYLANVKLGRQRAAADAFGRIVDHGLENKRLGVKFLFRAGSTAFWPDPKISGSYQLWLAEIASRSARSNACLEITGHTSPTGPEPINERLSLLRAEYVKSRLEREDPVLGKRTIANGVGSRETMVGTGRDDATDALDRRVEFKVIGC
jgi:outer membrane protein OmpA-like peptidoglycan-associated protein